MTNTNYQAGKSKLVPGSQGTTVTPIYREGRIIALEFANGAYNHAVFTIESMMNWAMAAKVGPTA